MSTRLPLRQIEPPVGAADGDAVVYDAARDRFVVSASGGGGGAAWDHPVTLPLSSLTGWTAGTGTWAVSGGVIRQSATTSASNRLRYTAARIPGSELVAEVDINVAVAPSTSLSRAGFLLAYPPAADTTGSILVALKSTTSGFITQVYWEYEGVVGGPGITLPSPIALGSWATFRVHKSGSDVTAWVNGTLIGTVHINQSSNVDASTIALYSYQTDVSFRNLDLWTPTLP